jgi:hypothetical protein
MPVPLHDGLFLGVTREIPIEFGPAGQGAVGTKLRDRSRSVKLGLFEIARIACAKGREVD